MPFTLRNIKEDLEDVTQVRRARNIEFRAATSARARESRPSASSAFPPGYRFPSAARRRQEEVYMVLRGSGGSKSTRSSTQDRTRYASARHVAARGRAETWMTS